MMRPRWIVLACGLAGMVACATGGSTPQTPDDAGPIEDASIGPGDAGVDHSLGEASLTSCTDGIQNGTETDIDCGGGKCPPCAVGKKCDTATSCIPGVCEKGICCESVKYRRSSGLGTGTVIVCCQGSDQRLSTCDCGVGMNHGASDYDASCGKGFEGAGNNGSPCVEVECEGLNCDPSVDAGHIDPTTCK